MSANARPPEALVAHAATLRAAGKDWDDIAKQIGRSAGRIRHWPREYAAVWKRSFREANLDIVSLAATEAVVTFRRLMRCDDPKIALAAADKLAQYLVKLRDLEKDQEIPPAPPPPPPPPPPKPQPSNEEILCNTPDNPTEPELRMFYEAFKRVTPEESQKWVDHDLRDLLQRDPQLRAKAADIAVELGYLPTPAATPDLPDKPEAELRFPSGFAPGAA
jgi:hypothetical protein